VQLLVGQAETPIFVHPKVLGRSSKFFRTAFKKDWLKDGHAIKLPEDESQIVSTYVGWLYTRKVICERLPSDFLDRWRAKNRRWILMAKLYVFAEKIMDTEFQDQVVYTFAVIGREIAVLLHACPATEAISIIYQGTPKDSPARKILVEIWNDHAMSHWKVKDSSPRLPQEFLEDLTEVVLFTRKLPAPTEQRNKGIYYGMPCPYQKHDDGQCVVN
jgi:hypothetical protein